MKDSVGGVSLLYESPIAAQLRSREEVDKKNEKDVLATKQKRREALNKLKEVSSDAMQGKVNSDEEDLFLSLKKMNRSRNYSQTDLLLVLL